MYKTIVFSEKPRITLALQEQLIKHFPAPILALHTLLLGPLQFWYPHNFKASELPIIEEAQYKPRTNFSWGARRVDLEGCPQVEYEDLLPEDPRQTEIVFACDPGYRGVVTFVLAVRSTFGPHALKTPVKAFSLTSLTSPPDPTEFDAMSSTWWSYGQTKEYVDWNFNANSIGILGHTLRQLAPEVQNPFMSKYMLQLLYYLQSEPPMRISDVLTAMQEWKGTGRYAPSVGLGSIVSRHDIIEQLEALSLIQLAEQGYKLTATGQAFLDDLHPDCKDLDLPFRLHAWCEAGLEASRSKIDKYIRTFFGKQKRFASGKRI